MTITALCLAVSSANEAEINRLIQENGINPNDADPQSGQRPIDFAIKSGKLRIIKLLVSLGGTITRSHNRLLIDQNIVLSFCFNNKSTYDHKDFLIWLLEPEQLLALQTDGIRPEHIYAALGRTPQTQDDLNVTDNDGLIPAYYAALVGNEQFTSWVPDLLKNNFLSHTLQEGLYMGANGAWWLSYSLKGLGILATYPQECLKKLNLYAKPAHLLSLNHTVLDRLFRGGQALFVNMDDEQFNSIDWNITDPTFGNTAAFRLTAGLSKHFSRLFTLPADKLAAINWNATSVLSGKTVALNIAETDKGRALLATLPAEIINTINWDAKKHVKDMSDDDGKRKVISWMANGSSIKQITPEFRMLLNKFTLNSLESLSNSLDEKDEAYKFILLKLLEQLYANLLTDSRIEPNLSAEIIAEKLQEFSTLFFLLSNLTIKHPELKKRINGFIGLIIQHMASSEEFSDKLLTMSNPFFEEPGVNKSLSNVLNRVKSLATIYLMRGTKHDRMLGCFYIHSFFDQRDAKTDMADEKSLENNFQSWGPVEEPPKVAVLSKASF